MLLPRLSKTAGQLVRDIGAGRRLYHADGSLTLRYGRGGGDGLRLSADIDGQRLTLWLAAEQWCQWIRPQLEVPDWTSINPELHPVLASWTLACAGDSLDYGDFSWPTGLTLEAASVPVAPYHCLDIEQDGRHLQAWVLEAPQAWLERLAAALDPLDTDETLGEHAIPVALIAGWSRIEQPLLTRLQPGDALLLHQRYPVADGTLGLFLNRPLATVAATDFATYTLEAVMEDFNDWLDVTPEASSSVCARQPDLLVTVVAQVASIDVPLQQLASLQVGDVLQGPARPEDGVLLKVAGRTIAHGLLLDIDGRLAVRIERFI
jgi:type III secretion protein Q